MGGREGEDGQLGSSGSVTISVMAASCEVGEGDGKTAENVNNSNSNSSTNSSKERNNDTNQDVIFEDLSSQHPGLRVFHGTLQAP